MKYQAKYGNMEEEKLKIGHGKYVMEYGEVNCSRIERKI